MPWKVIQKSYGKDPRRDARFHIQYASTQVHIDITCSYLNEGYKWFLKCDRLGIDHIVLGEVPQMNDQLARQAAVKYLEKVLENIKMDLDYAGRPGKNATPGS